MCGRPTKIAAELIESYLIKRKKASYALRVKLYARIITYIRESLIETIRSVGHEILALWRGIYYRSQIKGQDHMAKKYTPVWCVDIRKMTPIYASICVNVADRCVVGLMSTCCCTVIRNYCCYGMVWYGTVEFNVPLDTV